MCLSLPGAMGFPKQQTVAELRGASSHQGCSRHGNTAGRANIPSLLSYLGRNDACTGENKMYPRRRGGRDCRQMEVVQEGYTHCLETLPAANSSWLSEGGVKSSYLYQAGLTEAALCIWSICVIDIAWGCVACSADGVPS